MNKCIVHIVPHLPHPCLTNSTELQNYSITTLNNALMYKYIVRIVQQKLKNFNLI